MLRELMVVLSWVSPLTLLAGVLGIFIYSRKFSIVEWTIALFLIISFGIDLFSRYAIDLFGFESNLFLISIYVLIEYIFLSIMYNRFLPTKKSKPLLYITLFGGTIISMFLISKLAPIIPKEFQMYEGLFANLFSLLFGLFFIYKILVDDLQASSQQKMLNNIVIMYAGIQFFMALTINFMVNVQVELVFAFWLIRLIALTIFYSKLSHILWLPGKRAIQS
jgi:hypothetical protein